MPETKILIDPPPQKLKRKRSFWWTPLIIIFILLYAAFNVGVYMYSVNTKKIDSSMEELVHQPSPTPTPTPKPTPTPRPIPHGPMDFSVSQTDQTVPQFRNGHIDPYDPAKGATQTVTISVKHPQPVSSVSAVLKTDHNVSTPIPFTLISGTATDGTWKGSWQVTDSYLFVYTLEFKAISGTKTGLDVVTLR